MNELKSKTILFEETDLSPEKITIGNSIERSAINALAIATGSGWQELVRDLIEQAHIRSNMPSYKTCLTDLLRASGFVPVSRFYSISGLLKELNGSFANPKKVIVKMGASNYCALMPDHVKGQYVFKGVISARTPLEQRWIEEIWVYVPGSDNRTGIIRKTSEKTMPAESGIFTAKNMNPDGRRIGDCVIRALAAAYGCTWHEAIDHIASATLYEDPELNIIPNITTTLIKLGFERHKTQKIAGRLPNGKQICEHFNRRFHNKERIFAYVGRGHCAAILPVEDKDGLRYKIQDTWDSTSRGIAEFWVYKESEHEDEETQLTEEEPDFAVGKYITHPAFGEGIIIACNGEEKNRIIEVRFDTVGSKRLSEKWLKSLK